MGWHDGQGSDLPPTVSLSVAFESSTMFIIYLRTNTIFENLQWCKTWRTLTCPLRRPCQLLLHVARSPGVNHASSPLAAVSSVKILSVNWKNGSLGDREGSCQGDWIQSSDPRMSPGRPCVATERSPHTGPLMQAAGAWTPQLPHATASASSGQPSPALVAQVCPLMLLL